MGEKPKLTASSVEYTAGGVIEKNGVRLDLDKAARGRTLEDVELEAAHNLLESFGIDPAKVDFEVVDYLCNALHDFLRDALMTILPFETTED
ncbi:MAG: hypothetical protein DRP85_04080 [Candidatus Makaraimicrobium thalassicum]|nr:MAG: hypothetical protein DRP85_04080 [Candidatus Omnitrophota bacterium]